MNPNPQQIAKNSRTLPVAVADETIEAVNAARSQVPFAPSRSTFGRCAIHFTLAMLAQRKVTMETLANKYSVAPAAPAGER